MDLLRKYGVFGACLASLLIVVRFAVVLRATNPGDLSPEERYASADGSPTYFGIRYAFAKPTYRSANAQTTTNHENNS